MKIIKIIISAVVVIALSLFVCISPFAVDLPTVTDLGNGYTRIEFPNGVIRDLITEQLKPNGIVVNNNGTVSVSFNQASTQWNGVTYIVFNAVGEYDPVLTNLNNPKYTAFNDRLLWRTSALTRTKMTQLTLDVIKTSYPPPTSEKPIGTETVYKFFLSGADISRGSYMGENYTRWQFKDIANVINIGGDDGGNVPEDTTAFYFDFKLRFEDMNVNVLQGYNICREIALKMNFQALANDYSNNQFYFPMIDYQINVQSSDGKTYNLYNSDFLPSGSANEDIDILYDADFNWSAGSFFSVSFHITPYGNDPVIPDFQPDSFILNMYLYDEGHITLESPTVTNSVNTAVVVERLERKITLENDILDRFKNQLIKEGTIDDLLKELGIIVVEPDIKDIDDVDFSLVADALNREGEVFTFMIVPMTLSLTVATIGFAIVGKKG